MREPETHPDAEHRLAFEARDWIVQLTSGHVSEDQLARFKAWRAQSPGHARAFARERDYWQELAGIGAAPQGVPGAARPQRHLGRRGVLIGGGALAAAVAGAMVLPRVALWRNADFATAIGEMAEIPLADGSLATLNTDSAIAIDFTPALRQVHLLKGEAEFRVRPGAASFRVSALGGETDALGTVFSVRMDGERALVAVSEGRVRVSTATDEAVDLGPAQETSYAAGMAPQPPVAIDRELAFAWRHGRVIFEGRPFDQAIRELGRYVPERIVLGPGVDASVPVSAIVSTREVLPAIEALARTQGLAARRVPGVVIVIA